MTPKRKKSLSAVVFVSGIVVGSSIAVGGAFDVQPFDKIADVMADAFAGFMLFVLATYAAFRVAR